MYAIVQQGGHQFRVAPGDRLMVDQLAAPVGSMVALEPVLLVQGDDGPAVGTPSLEGARVAALVVGHRRGDKLRIFTYKPKKRHRRNHGFRSRLTELRIEAVLGAGEPMPSAPVAQAETKPAPRARRSARAAAAETTQEEAAPARTRTRTPRSRAQKPAPATDDFTEV